MQRRFSPVDALTALRDKPAGIVRITCGDLVLRTILLPKLTPLLREYEPHRVFRRALALSQSVLSTGKWVLPDDKFRVRS